jgi:PhoH-like ATPase
MVLDTNVLLHDAQAINKFQEHDVVIPLMVVCELDKFKKDMNELGRNARFFSNLADSCREKGSLKSGVVINELGATLTIGFVEEEDLKLLPIETDTDIYDNRIIATALGYKRRFPDRHVILVSKDTNVRIISDALELASETYENGQVDIDELFTGYRQIECNNLSKYLEPQLMSNATELDFEQPLYPNEFLALTEHHFDEDDVEYVRYSPESHLEPEQLIPLNKTLKPWDLEPRNDEQRLALELLMDDNIKLVTLIGKAGTGKTLLAIAAGLAKTTDEFVYRRVLVSRPVFPMGKDLGFLPGDINEKLAPYMQPIYDNIEVLTSGYMPDGVGKFKKLPGKKKSKKEEKIDEEKEAGNLGSGYLELLAAGILKVEPLTYIRGRSIPEQYLIVDEAQNLTPHEIKTIITRVGEGTKIVITGDPYQIDNPFLDASSNGLTYVVEQFKGQAIAGHVTLTKGVRSELAEIASNIL